MSTRSVSVVWTPEDTQALRETADRHPTEAGTGTVDSERRRIGAEMSEYAVIFISTASASVRVEADDADEAIDKAWDAGPPTSLCHQCARAVDLSGEWEPDAVIDDITGDTVWERGRESNK